MLDILPFLRLLGDTPEKQIVEITDYLMQFKETLEFALMNISSENLSPELQNKLNELWSTIKKNNSNQEEAIVQISSKTGASVSDIINSQMFKTSLKNEVANIKFSINWTTGHLEYSIQ